MRSEHISIASTRPICARTDRYPDGVTALKLQKPSSHASADIPRRRHKAEKIIRLLDAERPITGLRILDVGAGSGIIAASIAERAGPDSNVTAVDLTDQRVVSEGFHFVLVKDAVLPFPNRSFDIVISNHVIEHIGGPRDQLMHLKETHRVLSEGGIGYFSAPNRWALLEPHYRLPLLSWLPTPLANAYVRVTRKGDCYDCYPPGPLRLHRMLRTANLNWQSKAADAIRIMLEVEPVRTVNQIATRIPASLLNTMSPVLPTFVLILKKRLTPSSGDAHLATYTTQLRPDAPSYREPRRP